MYTSVQAGLLNSRQENGLSHTNKPIKLYSEHNSLPVPPFEFMLAPWSIEMKMAGLNCRCCITSITCTQLFIIQGDVPAALPYGEACCQWWLLVSNLFAAQVCFAHFLNCAWLYTFWFLLHPKTRFEMNELQASEQASDLDAPQKKRKEKERRLPWERWHPNYSG